MAKSKMKRKRTPKSVLKFPDLEQSRSAVLNSLISPSSRRTYDHAIREFIEWYCSDSVRWFCESCLRKASASIRGVFLISKNRYILRVIA
jgi:hypothetical protein